MMKIPVVFCFDDNLLMPAGVCLNSLLLHADTDTYYDIFILHDDTCSFPQSGYLERLKQRYNNFDVQYRSVGKAFQGAFEIRGITIATYYRLLIPELITEYDRVFYFDVDIIFRMDLSTIYVDTDLSGYYVAGVATPYTDIAEHITEVIKMDIHEYICGGTTFLNIQAMRQDNLIRQFQEKAKKNWKYQDQDILNMVCKGKIKLLPPWFGIVGTINEIVADKQQPYYDQQTVEQIQHYGILHFNGTKPWKGWCYNLDIWWEYYRKSPYYDATFYFDFFHRKLTEYDRLPFLKRVKILLRYFKTRL